MALPMSMAAHRSALTLAASKLGGALRHAVAGRAALAARVLPRLTAAPVEARLRESQARLEGLAARLESVSHKAVLARGYAAVFGADGHPVTKAASVKPGAALRIDFADGDVRATAVRDDKRQGALPL
jgi:exodeoxyribonuclease VII large subunit